MDRHVRQRDGSPDGRLTGQAVFTADGGGLRYTESGTLRIEGQPPLAASRTYLWYEEGGGIAVRFDDGRPFHRFRPDAGQPAATHDCPPDTYRVTYDFDTWPVWRTRWEVTGPRKDYVMETLYHPATQP